MVLLRHAPQYLLTTVSGGALHLAGGFQRVPVARPKTGALRQAPATVPSVIEETRVDLHQLSAAVELRPAPDGEVQLSVVIPAYNEQARLPRTVVETIRWCTSEAPNFELIIVDDGSQDETLALARRFEKSDLRVHVLACPHLGKGAAVRAGALNAEGRFVLFMDADGATPLDQIPKLLAAMDEGHDVAIGSRAPRGPGEVEVRTPLHRRLVGRTFALVVRLLAFDGIADTQCGFKMFRRDAAIAIFSQQKIVGFAFDVEVLFIARRLALSITEIPVNWVAQPGSKVSLVADSTKMLWDISRIRWMHRGLGSFRSPAASSRLSHLSLAGKGAAPAGTTRGMAAPLGYQAPEREGHPSDVSAASVKPEWLFERK